MIKLFYTKWSYKPCAYLIFYIRGRQRGFINVRNIYEVTKTPPSHGLSCYADIRQRSPPHQRTRANIYIYIYELRIKTFMRIVSQNGIFLNIKKERKKCFRFVIVHALLFIAAITGRPSRRLRINNSCLLTRLFPHAQWIALRSSSINSVRFPFRYTRPRDWLIDRLVVPKHADLLSALF